METSGALLFCCALADDGNAVPRNFLSRPPSAAQPPTGIMENPVKQVAKTLGVFLMESSERVIRAVLGGGVAFALVLCRSTGGIRLLAFARYAYRARLTQTVPLAGVNHRH